MATDVQDGNEVDDSSVHPKVAFEDAWKFIVRVGLAAHRYGSTAGRLEAFLKGASRKFGYEGTFRSSPSEIVFALREGPGSAQRVEFISTQAPGIDLDKLARVGDLLNAFGAGKVSLTEVTARLDAIDRAPPPWGKLVSMLGYALTGMGLPPLLGGGWSATLHGTIFSMLVYGLVQLSERVGSAATKWLPLSSAFAVGFLASIVRLWVPELDVVLVVLAAVAIILPGYTISLGVGELVAQHVVSGWANLMNGLVCLAKQIAGGWLGIAAASLVVSGVAAGPATPVSTAWLFLFFPLLAVGLCLALQTSRRDLPWALLLCGIAYLGIRSGSALLDSPLGSVAGTALAVVSANLWARRTQRPSSIVLIPAIVVLVGGTIGFRGLAAMVRGDVLHGSRDFVQMFVVALTILAGGLVGNAILRPEPGL